MEGVRRRRVRVRGEIHRGGEGGRRRGGGHTRGRGRGGSRGRGRPEAGGKLAQRRRRPNVSNRLERSTAAPWTSNFQLGSGAR